ncbi:MAG: Holliday junction branch migration DNA helicase RuvB, partial [Corynebacterium variabile]
MGDVERTEFDLSGAGSPGPARPDRPDRTDRTDRGNDALSDRMLPGDDDAELSLRPRSLTEFIGQPKVRGQLDLVLGGARARGVVPDHVLLAGPPGLGKTTMAMIIAQELGTSLRMTSGPALERAGDLAAMLSNLMEGDVLFIDEIHRMARPAEEMLYMAMEDFRIDVIVGKGPGATSIPIELPPFTLVGATTRAGMLTGPLRDRFGFTAHLEFYPREELEKLVERSAAVLGVMLGDGSAQELSLRSRGTPRIANRMLRRVRDWATVHDLDIVRPDAVREALALYQIDSEGLD